MIHSLEQQKPHDRRQVAIAELESAGLSVRTINLLEDHLHIIWLDELLQYTPDELKAAVPNLGDKTLQEILACVRRFQKRSPAAPQRIVGVGCQKTGLVDSNKE